jgi:hypothetical protein
MQRFSNEIREKDRYCGRDRRINSCGSRTANFVGETKVIGKGRLRGISAIILIQFSAFLSGVFPYIRSYADGGNSGSAFAAASSSRPIVSESSKTKKEIRALLISHAPNLANAAVQH